MMSRWRVALGHSIFFSRSVGRRKGARGAPLCYACARVITVSYAGFCAHDRSVSRALRARVASCHLTLCQEGTGSVRFRPVPELNDAVRFGSAGSVRFLVPSCYVASGQTTSCCVLEHGGSRMVGERMLGVQGCGV